MLKEKQGTENSPDCLLLSSGQSGRMGQHKAYLSFSEKESFLEHIINVYLESGIQKIYIVIHPEMKISNGLAGMKELRFIVNQYPEKGRLRSIQSGLHAMKESRCCYIQNIDNPFIDPSLLQNLARQLGNEDYVSPVYNNRGGHPILISSKVINYIAGLTNYTQTLQDVLKLFKRSDMIVESPSILININTPEEYEKHFPEF
jgi:molybdenum cofactor cytidylyltransferase